MSPHVERLVHLFAKKDKRERLLFLAAKAGRWSDFRDALLHDTRSLDAATMTPLTVAKGDAYLFERLRAKPDARAYCVSEIPEIDDRELPSAKALEACVGRARDTLVFCIDGERAFYENHEGEQYILARVR